MPIRILPTEVASQIAAGEVVERPASVVKELIENALDAQAHVITITVAGAGRSMIEVADDGDGIPPEELALAVERHATSKLSRAEDLFQITTLGFRGEALASIGSVSRLTVTSRPRASEVGSRLRVEGGQVFTPQPIGAPNGTSVRVEDLFYNVPARFKFLKTDPTERRVIENLVTRYALAYPSVRFHLQLEERTALHTSGNGNRREVLGELYGADTARQMLEVLFKDDHMEVQGFISPTAITRPHRREIHFFVNGRPVQDAALSAALLKGYHSLLMVGRYPLTTLFLSLPPQNVDVNVHPTKAEVRFGEPDQIFTSLQSAVRRALLAHNPAPGIQDELLWGRQPDLPGVGRQPDPAWSMRAGFPYSSEFPPRNWEASIAPETDAETSEPPESASQPTLQSHPSQANAFAPILRPVGQIASAYLVAEGPDGIYLIDQHAAHERILYERYMQQRSGTIPSQALLQPAAVNLPSGAARLLEEQLPVLNQLGFQIESFGPGSFLVRSIPVLLSGVDPATALSGLVENFEEDETPLQNQVEARLIARICKRSAVKAGKTLSVEEQRALIRDLENCQSPRTCPHGRPTMIHLSVDLLERQFGRKGAR